MATRSPAQTSGGAVAYDIHFDPVRHRWYLDASWTVDPEPAPTLARLGGQRTFAVDLNVDHVAGWVVDPTGNAVGTPRRFAVPTDGPTSHRDAQVRHLVTRIIHAARAAGCTSVTIENLNFTEATSRDNPKGPRGTRGKRLRAKVAGIPTARFRDRLSQMSANAGLWVVAVDPAYTSQWGRTLIPQLALQTPEQAAVTVHDGAAVMVGRRGLGHDRQPGRVGPAPSPADDGQTPHRPQRPRSRGPRQTVADWEPRIVTRSRVRAREPGRRTHQSAVNTVRTAQPTSAPIADRS